MNTLSNKKVLFFAPKFFGYELAIKAKLEEMGADVTYFDERPKNTFWTKVFIRINRNIISSQIKKYYNQVLNQTAAKQFDYVFVVNLEAMTPKVIEKLRKQQPNARFILYMWDSIRNKKPAQIAFPLFDWCYSFDRDDANNLTNVVFRPLFFIDTFDTYKWKDKPNVKYDLCFIGTVHSDRYNLISDVKKQLLDSSKSFYFYMYFHNRVLFLYKKFRDVKFLKAPYSEFNFNSISAIEIMNKIKHSFAVFDVQHPYQTGLTMRTIEMIGAERKLITTNKAIAQYDFYNPNNILIIDRNKPILKNEFWDTPYQPIDEEQRKYYSIEGWIKTIFKLA
ncbi:MAG: hypothetical protein H3C45_00045 [Bacteroidia bacterium]|nr:hypothetical protein [Bacteroidia bacterium]